MEQAGHTLQNRRELFNLQHSTFWTKIESAFEILKSRFKILLVKPHHPFPTQVEIVLACTVLHNYISIVDPYDKFLHEEVILSEKHGDTVDENDDDIINFLNAMIVRQQVEVRDE